MKLKFEISFIGDYSFFDIRRILPNHIRITEDLMWGYIYRRKLLEQEKTDMILKCLTMSLDIEFMSAKVCDVPIYEFNVDTLCILLGPMDYAQNARYINPCFDITFDMK
jgi:hypothetical protein